MAALLCLAALSLAGCRPASLVAPAPQTLRIAGSTSFAGALRELGDAYQAQHPNVVVDVRSSGSGAGIRALATGEVDLAAVSWEPAKDALPEGFTAVPVARDAVAVIVHPSNTVTALTLLQIRALYAGEVLNWSAFGPDRDTLILSREDGSGTRAAFEALVMGGERVTLNALVLPSSQAMVDYVATHPGAIGYVSTAAVDKRVRALRVEDLLPDRENVQAGTYHLARLIYLCRPPHAGPTGQAFLDFALSPAGQAIIARRHSPVR